MQLRRALRHLLRPTWRRCVAAALLYTATAHLGAGIFYAIEGGEERIIEGRLQERTTTDVVINVKGRMVKIPWHLVGEVRLPPAKSE